MAFHHFAMATQDMQATHRFYSEAMGFELVKVEKGKTPGEGWAKHFFYATGDGEMMAFFRNSDPARRVKRSVSADGGATWSAPELTDRLHPGGGIEALVLKNGHLLLIYNNKEKSPRDKLAVALSTDRGQTWPHERQLEDTPNGRFDYPSIIQTKYGTLHVTYSYNLKTIKHVQFNEAWVMQKDAS